MDEELRMQVAGWLAGGATVSEIHKRLDAESRLPLSRLDVRILVDDLQRSSGQAESQTQQASSGGPGEDTGTIDTAGQPLRATNYRRWLLCIPVLVCLWFIYHWYQEAKPHSIPVADAKMHVGEETFVIGEVFGIKHLLDGKVLVDFGDFYPRQQFTAVFTPEAYADVREEHGGIKVGDVVSVHGVIRLYEGRPQMTIGVAGDVVSETDIRSEAAWSER